MNQDELNPSAEPTSSNMPLPGQLIRQTREQRGLSVQDLSEKSRLTENVINAVERDDYAAMGEPVYARGYYRKCGEALSLNAERLVEAYEQHSGTGSPVPTIEQRPSIAYREGPGKLALGIAIGLILLVFFVCGLWMLGDDVPTVDAAPVASANSKSGDEREQSSQPVAESQFAVVSPTPTPGNNQVPPQAATLAPATSQSQHAEVRPQQPDRALPQATVAPQMAQAEVSQQKPISAQNITLRVEIRQGEAWVDVSDKDGEKLLYKLLKDGDVRSLEGVSPLRVSLGRADHVRFLLDGQSVDFQAQIEDGLTANFLIDANGRVYDAASVEAP